MFTQKELQLKQEAELTSSMLKSGLNSLRKAATYGRAGEYYQSFFSLSVGIERMLKIIIITKFRCENEGVFPTLSECPVKGHNLIDLWDKAELTNLEGIENKILVFLDHFAGYLRYFNLDNILENNGKNMSGKDPLHEWRIIQLEILEKTGKKQFANKKEMCNLVDEDSDVFFHDLCGNKNNSFHNILDEIVNEDTLQGYSVEYIFNIIKRMKNKICYLENKKYLMPVISEFFDFYTDYWKPYEIRRKKNWLST